MTGVIYARYSSDNQREESIEGQLRECMAFAERSGITIIANYIDRAMSARTADRPDFQRMIKDSEKKLFDVVIVWKLDRFSRDRYDSANYKHILKKNGVKVVSATENITDGPEGVLLESLLEGLSEYYSAELSVKIHAPAHAKAEEEYLLTTKLFCGKCGTMLVGESGKSRTGEVYHYYKCGNAKRGKGCKLKTLKKRWIERAVVATTIQRVMNDEVIDRIADALVDIQDKKSTMLPSLNQQLKECEKSIQNMLNAIEAGIITPSTKERLQTLEARREEIKIAIMQEQLQRPKLTKEQIVFWISRYKHGDPNDLDYQRQIIDTFVNRIYVYDDRLVLTYNYKDGTESITLKDIEKAFGSDLSSIAPPLTLGSLKSFRGFFYKKIIMYGKDCLFIPSN